MFFEVHSDEGWARARRFHLCSKAQARIKPDLFIKFSSPKYEAQAQPKPKKSGPTPSNCLAFLVSELL
jgi:hypothetical protein